MYELSLFSGAGGGLLSSRWLLGYTCVGYVEIDDYCQRILAQRIKDGLLDDAPIFGDIRTFISEGYAQEYQGVATGVTAGFPCQPFSVAGRRKGEQDERNMWPETIQYIRLVRPRYAFLENVPGLLTSGYMPTIFGDLAEAGYNARWTVLGADDVGAPHKRKRLWILAYSLGQRRRDGTGGNNRQKENIRIGIKKFGWGGITVNEENNNKGKLHQWNVEPRLGRVAHGVACRVDRLKAIGNGQVPQVAALAWNILTQDLPFSSNSSNK
jgi:DNA (cytosine-5)-methyltransferase 1